MTEEDKNKKIEYQRSTPAKNKDYYFWSKYGEDGAPLFAYAPDLMDFIESAITMEEPGNGRRGYKTRGNRSLRNSDDLVETLEYWEYGLPPKRTSSTGDTSELLPGKAPMRNNSFELYPEGLLANATPTGSVLRNIPFEMSKEEMENYRKSNLKPHVNEKDNTAVEEIDYTKPRSSTKGGTVSSFIGGLDLVNKQIDYSMQYLMKGVERVFCGNDRRAKEIEREMENIADEYSNLPIAEGMAQVSSIGANIATVALPSLISGLFGGPKVAAVVGTGMSAFDVVASGAQADMEVQSYENSTGVEVGPGSRAAYVVSVMATNLLLDAFSGSKVFKAFAPKVIGDIGTKIQRGIFTNPVAQKEFNAMTSQVLRNERKNILKNMRKEAAKSFVEGGVLSGALEAERSIYTHEAPELSRIVDEAVTGAVWNATQGTMLSGITGYNMHKQRMKRDNVYYASDNPSSPDGLSISEITDVSVYKDPVTGKEMVEGRVVSPDDRGGTTVRVPAENIAQGSYRSAHADGATQHKGDHWDIPQEKMDAYNDKWERAKELMDENPDEAYAMQNEVAQGIAADMGLPINVYAHLEDLPDDVLRSGNPGDAYAVTVNNETPMLILDNCKDLSAKNLKSVIVHEMVGHKGVPQTYDKQSDYDRDVADAYYNVVINEEELDPRLDAAIKGGWYRPEHEKFNRWQRVAEEKSALMSETRDYALRNHIPKGYEKMYRMLRRGENMLRNSTVNELRKDYYRGGNPMPTLYELEQE